ncbi:MAG: TonB-dependent receptor, partial [Alistipes sp.]|nr:TonB-dependent receptor [Alistipes sp.]
NRFATFPAMSAGWRISNEQFMEGTRRWLSDLKLRASWGQTGNQEIGNYVTRTLYTTDYGLGDPTWGGLSGTAYDFLGNGSGQLSSGYKQIQRGNPNLKWETTTQTNLGVDFGLLNQRLYGSLEFYIKDTKDILINPPYIGVIGEGGSTMYNGASMSNKGVEFQHGYSGSKGSFSYDIIGNISAYRNKVTKLPEEVENSYGGNGMGDNILGRPIGSYYGYIADGIFKTQEEVDAHANQPGKAVGRIRYRDLDGSGTVDDGDRTWIGKVHPDFTWGLNVSLQYKAFDMMVFFNGVQGVDLNVYDVKSQTDFWSVNDTRSNKGTRLLGAWSVDNPRSTIPALEATNSNDEGRFSTYFIENGSYMKLRNIQIGYTLPSSVAQKIKLEKLRFYISGQNLFTVKSKRFTGIDPENALFGYPIPVTCTFGINLSF